MSILTALPPVIERHELKYTIPFGYIEPISRFVEIYCELDHYSSISADNFYQINSLYFDTRGLEFLRQRIYGKDGRFNIRVRCYGNLGEAPYFLEIKKKQGFTGIKYRSLASKDEWPGILNDPLYRIPKTDTGIARSNKENFLRLALSYDIIPQIFTQYKRKAYVSSVDEYARVTMDICMKYRIQNHYDLKPDDSMVSYDNETIYANNTRSEATVILELKCNVGQVPTWMLDLIALFELKQQGFSKYLNSSLVSLIDNGVNYMSGDLCGSY